MDLGVTRGDNLNEIVKAIALSAFDLLEIDRIKRGKSCVSLIDRVVYNCSVFLFDDEVTRPRAVILARIEGQSFASEITGTEDVLCVELGGFSHGSLGSSITLKGSGGIRRFFGLRVGTSNRTCKHSRKKENGHETNKDVFHGNSSESKIIIVC